MTGSVRPQWLGRLPYGWALRLQRGRREAVLDGRAPEALWLLEHEPVITTGRREVPELPSRATLRDRGIALHQSERGGLATWHGPGQLVGYLVLDVRRRGLGARATVAAVEQGLIAWLRGRGVQAGRHPRHPGVWVGAEKIAALGLHFRRGVSMHGFALNLAADLGAYELFVPCGIRDGGVTSLARLQGWAPACHEVADEVGWAVLEALVAAGR